MPGKGQFALGFVLTALAIVPGISRGDDPSLSGGSIPSDPVFTALLTDGSTVSGQIRRLGEKDGVTLVDDRGDERPILLDRLVKLTRDGTPPPSTTDGGDIVIFPDGDRLSHCKIGRAGEFNLGVHSFALEDLSIPLDSMLGFLLDPGIDSGTADALVARVRTEPRESELLWLKNGDKLPGLFAGLDDKKMTFQPATGKIEFPRMDVESLGFAQGQVVYRRPEGPFLELTLGDGSRLGVTGAKIERGRIVATTRFKTPIRVPVGELAQVHVINGPVAYLSDREASGAIYEPYLGPIRPYRRNSSVTGQGLRLGGRAFDRGLGTQSRTLLAYKLEPGSKRFQVLVGLDDRAGPLGSVVFKVRIDDKIAYDSATMVVGEAPKVVDLDIEGARFLILMTEFGERGDVQDHADWVEARIVR